MLLSVSVNDIWNAGAAGSEILLAVTIDDVLNQLGFEIIDPIPGEGLIFDGSKFVNTTLSVGTITSVGLVMPGMFTVTNSPLLSDGDITVTLNDQAANTVLAGPITGADAAPTYRALVTNDIPDLSAVYQ